MLNLPNSFITAQMVKNNLDGADWVSELRSRLFFLYENAQLHRKSAQVQYCSPSFIVRAALRMQFCNNNRNVIPALEDRTDDKVTIKNIAFFPNDNFYLMPTTIVVGPKVVVNADLPLHLYDWEDLLTTGEKYKLIRLNDFEEGRLTKVNVGNRRWREIVGRCKSFSSPRKYHRG